MAYSSIQTPNIPICLPELDIVISNGSDPGIQVCDFLLWAVQRDVFRGDSTWVRRSKLFMHSAYRIEANPLSGNEYYLNNMIHDDLLVSIEQIPEPSVLEQHWNQNGISIGMVNIELQLRGLGAQNHLVKNSRLRNRLLSLIPKLKEVKLHNDSIIEMAKLYLLLADQAPLYDIKKPDEIILAYHYKKICSKTADLHNLDSFRFCQHWRLVREWINQNDKEVLFKE